VLALIDAGAADERAGRIEAAESNYRRAVGLDPMSQPAQQALARIRARKSDEAFAAEMSRGLAALERGEHDAAREAFRRAGEMRPGSPEIAEALLQVQQRESLDAIVRYREEAAAAEAREDWHAAADRYDAILKLDPSIRFAQEGHRRSSARADLADRIDYHLANPGRLSTEEVFEEAVELLVEASEVEPAGPRHRQRVAALDRLVEVAGTPLPVVLVSDAVTQVIVYKVGRMGAFERRELQLRPGVYTVVGSRPGYRDVRKSLVVEAGKESPPLTVICEEPI
jgi:tetratricopeptide (TPR) repeat protein